VLSPANNVKIVAIDEGLQMGDDVLEFDGSLSNHQRSEFLQYFCAKNRLIVARWNQKPADIKGKENMGAKENQPTQKSGVAGYAIVSPCMLIKYILYTRC
jgi:hypothetical protein